MVLAHGALAQDGDPAGDSIYVQARELLNRNDFAAAAEQFQLVWKDHDGARSVNEARYWQAYAIFRSTEAPDELKEALNLLKEQREKYPKSPVASDAVELSTRIRGKLASLGDAQAAYEIAQEASEKEACGQNAEVRIAALSALQNMQNADIMPTLRKLFEQHDSCSAPIRARALAIMAVRPITETEDVVILAAKDPDEDIRRRAIPLLAQGSSDAAVNTMGKLLAAENDREMQFALLSALAYNSNPRARRLLKDFVARPEVDDELKERAIMSLVGSACGTEVPAWRREEERKSPKQAERDRKEVIKENGEYLRDLYKSVKNPGLRQRIVESVVQVGGDDNTDWLLDVASDPKEELDVRRAALFATGFVGDQGRSVRYSGCRPEPQSPDKQPSVPVKSLVKLYNTIDDQQIREQLLLAYSRRADSDDAAMDKLVEVAKDDRDPQLRQRAIFWLSQLKSKRAAKALAEIVSQSR